MFESIRQIKAKNTFQFLTEEETNNSQHLSKNSETFQKIQREIQEKLPKTLFEIDYVTIIKTSGHNKIEVSGSIRNNMIIRFEYGDKNKFCISTENFEMNQNDIEDLRLLYIYYDNSFAELCKQLITDY